MARQGWTRLGVAWLGWARLGLAGRGKARLGWARHGIERLQGRFLYLTCNKNLMI